MLKSGECVVGEGAARILTLGGRRCQEAEFGLSDSAKIHAATKRTHYTSPNTVKPGLCLPHLHLHVYLCTRMQYKRRCVKSTERRSSLKLVSLQFTVRLA